MGNLTLAAQNSIDTGATFYGDQDTGFELTKLADTNFSKFWRYTPAANVDGSVARFALSLGLITRLNHAAFCRHNLSQGAQVRMRAGTSRFDSDFTDGTELTSPWITFGGGANGTRTNEYGVMVSGGAPRYEHDRRFYDNGFKYSEDLTQADWLVALANKYSDGVTVNFEVGAGDPTERVTNGSFNSGLTGWNVLDNFGTADASSGQLILTDGSGRVTYSQQITVTPGKRYFVSAKIGGTGTGTLRVNKTNNFAAIDTVNLASNQGLTLTGTFTATQANMWVCLGPGSGLAGQTGTFDDITITEIGSQLYQVPGFMYADNYEVRAQVRLVSGDPTFRLKVSDDSASPSFSSALTATTQWQWFSASLACPSATVSATRGHGGIYKTGAGGVLQIRRLQLRRGASNGKYRKTTSQRRYQRIGVISETSSTNNVLRSAELENAAWNKNGVTITANSTAAPDGATSMDTVTFTGSSLGYYQDYAGAGNTKRAHSLIFRTESTFPKIDLYVIFLTGGVTQTAGMTIDPTKATVVTPSITAGGASVISSGIRDLGGGFYRAYVVAQGTDAANTTVRFLVQSNGAATGTLIAWGHQGELNFPTTYIPTTTAAVTRTAQTAAIEPTTWVPYAANASEGTLYHEASVDEIVPDQAREGSYVQMGNGGSSYVVSYMEYIGGGLGAAYCEVYSSGVLQRRGTITNFTLGTTQRQAFRYRSGDWSFYLNGVKNAASAGSDTISFVPSITAINLMFNSQTTSYVRRVTLWPTGKSDADLQALTTSGPSAIDYDGGWSDAMQMSLNGDVSSTWGYDYDVIRTFTSRAVEWVRVGIYDPDKTDGATPIECGRLFMGKLSLQPGINASFGLTDGWDDSATTFVETQNRRKVFNVLPKLREVIFDLPYLTPDEGAILHEMDGSGGLSSEVLYLSDPDDLAACQRFGFVGLMEKLDPLKYPLFNARGKSYQIRKKR